MFGIIRSISTFRLFGVSLAQPDRHRLHPARHRLGPHRRLEVRREQERLRKSAPGDLRQDRGAQNRARPVHLSRPDGPRLHDIGHRETEIRLHHEQRQQQQADHFEPARRPQKPHRHLRHLRSRRRPREPALRRGRERLRRNRRVRRQRHHRRDQKEPDFLRNGPRPQPRDPQVHLSGRPDRDQRPVQ